MDATPAQRHVQRHNPISIRLHLALDGDWHRIEARQWNARGFCFFHSTPLATGPTAFKRSLQHFEGDIVWSRASHDEAQVTEMLLNEAIHRHAGSSQVQPETQRRLLKLMRVQGMPEAKQRVLSALGGMPQPQEWQDQVARRMTQAMYQFGVRVEAPAWQAVVTEAMALGGVVQDLERWSGSLAGV